MAVSISSHRIQTIHGSFSTGIATPSSALAAQASSFARLPNVSLSSSRGQGLSILAARTSSASASKCSSAPRRLPVGIPASARRAPPPPPRTAVVRAEDPFADTSCEITSLPPPPRTPHSAPAICSRTRLSSYTTPPPPGLEPVSAETRDGTARGRLVANVLLSRGCGRPARRRPGRLGERPYVKSGLSRMVEVEA